MAKFWKIILLSASFMGLYAGQVATQFDYNGPEPVFFWQQKGNDDSEHIYKLDYDSEPENSTPEKITSFSHGRFTKNEYSYSALKFVTPNEDPNKYNEIIAQANDNSTIDEQDLCGSCFADSIIIAVHALYGGSYMVVYSPSNHPDSFKVAKVSNNVKTEESKMLYGFISSQYSNYNNGLFVIKENEAKDGTELWFFGNNQELSTVQDKFHSFTNGEKAMFMNYKYFYFLDPVKKDINVFSFYEGVNFVNLQQESEKQIILQDKVSGINLDNINSLALREGNDGEPPELIVLAGDGGIYLLDVGKNAKQIYTGKVNNLIMEFYAGEFTLSSSRINMGIVPLDKITILQQPSVSGYEATFTEGPESKTHIIKKGDMFYLDPPINAKVGEKDSASFTVSSVWGDVEEYTVVWEYGNKPKLEVELEDKYELTVPEITPHKLPMANGNAGVQADLFLIQQDTQQGAEASSRKVTFNLHQVTNNIYPRLLTIQAEVEADLPLKITLESNSSSYFNPGKSIVWQGYVTAAQLSAGFFINSNMDWYESQYKLYLEYDLNDEKYDSGNSIDMEFTYEPYYSSSFCKTYAEAEQIEMVCIPTGFNIGETYDALLIVNDGVSTSMFYTEIEVAAEADLGYKQKLSLDDIYLPKKAGTYTMTSAWLGRYFDLKSLSSIYDAKNDESPAYEAPINFFSQGEVLNITLSSEVTAGTYEYYFLRDEYINMNTSFTEQIPFKIIVVEDDPVLSVTPTVTNVVQAKEATVNIQVESDEILFNKPIIGAYEDIYTVDYVSDNNTINAKSIIQTFKTTTAKTLNHITIPVNGGSEATYTIVEYNEEFGGYSGLGLQKFKHRINEYYEATSITIPVGIELEAEKTYALLIKGENDGISLYSGSKAKGTTLWEQDYSGNLSPNSDKVLVAYFDYSESYDWISVTGENNQWTATFEPDYSVTPGQYDLQVRTRTADGFFNLSPEKLTVTVMSAPIELTIDNSEYSIEANARVADTFEKFATITGCPSDNCKITVTKDSGSTVFTNMDLSADGTLTFNQTNEDGTAKFTVKACRNYATDQEECSEEKTFMLNSVKKPVITPITSQNIETVDAAKEGKITVEIDGCGTDWSLCELSFSVESKNKLITNLQQGEGFIEYSQQPGDGTFSVTVEVCLIGTEICSEPQTIIFNIEPAELPPLQPDDTSADSLASPTDTIPKLVGEFTIETNGLAMRALFPRNAGAKAALRYEMEIRGWAKGAPFDTSFASATDTIVWTGVPAGTWSVSWLALHNEDTLRSGSTSFTIAVPVRQVASNTWTMLGLGQNSALWSQIDPQAELWVWDDSYAFGPYGGYKDREGFTKLNPGQAMWYYGPAWEMQNPQGGDQPVKVSLIKETTGWNMVANPYSWGVKPPQMNNSTCWSWENDEYVPAEVIAPFGACWVQVSKTQDYTFAPKAAFASAAPVAPAALPKLTQNALPHNWVGQLALRAGKWKDSYNYIGVADREQVGAKPPRAPDQKVALEIVHQNQKLHQHIRSAGSNAQWDLHIESALDIDATLQLDGIGHLARYGQAMVLKQGAQVQEVSPTQGAQLLLRKGENSAQLMVVRRTQLAALTQGLSGLRAQVLPQGLALSVEVPLALQGQTLTVEWVSLDGTVLARQKFTPANAGTVQVQMRTAQVNSGLSLVRVRTASSSISATVMR